MSTRAMVKRRIALDVAPTVLASVDLGVTDRVAETIPCAYSFPPDEATETCCYFGGLEPVDGSTEVTSLGNSVQARRGDGFTLKGTIDVFGFDSDVDSDEAAERVLNVLSGWVKANPHLLYRSSVGPAVDDPDDGGAALQRTTVKLGRWSLQNFAPIGDTHVSRISFDLDCETTHA